MDRAPFARIDSGAPALPRWFWPVALSIAAWLAVWIFITRYAMLDDSLIHLRYAINLQRLHFVTYDGAHHTFGTSSPLYVSILAVGYQLWHSPFVPKLVSVVSYLALLGLALVLYLRVRHHQLAGALALLFFPVLLCPMGMRWLTDGMETSLVCASVVILAFLTFTAAKSPWRASDGLLMFLMGFYLTTLRIELASLCAFIALTLFLARWHRGDRAVVRTLLKATPIVVGSAAALFLMRGIFGYFLPDTALAKASGSPSLSAIYLFLHVTASSTLLGVGSFILLLLTAVLGWRHVQAADSNGRLAFLAANVNLPFILLLSSIRGQAIQAVRYVLWATFFGIVWNLLTMAESGSRKTWKPSEQKIVGVTAVVFLLLLPFDIWLGGHTMLGRARTFQQMRSESLDRLAGHTMLADDIGFIGYFSKANVCDMNGLVNGRQFAALTQKQRIQACADQNPDAIFLTVPRIQMMNQYFPSLASDWIACERVDFTNVLTSDRHYLLVRKVDTDRLCPRATALRMPIADIRQVASSNF